MGVANGTAFVPDEAAFLALFAVVEPTYASRITDGSSGFHPQLLLVDVAEKGCGGLRRVEGCQAELVIESGHGNTVLGHCAGDGPV